MLASGGRSSTSGGSELEKVLCTLDRMTTMDEVLIDVDAARLAHANQNFKILRALDRKRLDQDGRSAYRC